MDVTPLISKAGACVARDGSALPCLWKAIRRNTGDLVWEFRRILDTIGENNNTAMKRARKRHLVAATSLFQTIDPDIDHICFEPSKRMVLARGTPLPPDVRDEAQISTLNLVLFLIAGGDSRVAGAPAGSCASTPSKPCSTSSSLPTFLSTHRLPPPCASSIEKARAAW